MSSEQEILRLQQIAVAGIVLISLSIGIGGFESIETWHQIEIEHDESDDDGDTSDANFDMIFSLGGWELSMDVTTYYSYDDSTDSYSNSVDYDYGEANAFEESENAMANVQRGGYLAVALLIFALWKLQEMKTETTNEVREVAFKQIKQALQVAGVVILAILLYYYQASAFEEDFDKLFASTNEEDDDEGNFFGVECDAAWTNKPEFEWSGTTKYKYDEGNCPENSWNEVGDGEFDISPGMGFFAFAAALIPIYLVFNGLKPRLMSFSVPSIPSVPVQVMEANKPPPITPPSFVENDLPITRRETAYQKPDISVMAIPEDEDS